MASPERPRVFLGTANKKDAKDLAALGFQVSSVELEPVQSVVPTPSERALDTAYMNLDFVYSRFGTAPNAVLVTTGTVVSSEGRIHGIPSTRADVAAYWDRYGRSGIDIHSAVVVADSQTGRIVGEVGHLHLDIPPPDTSKLAKQSSLQKQPGAFTYGDKVVRKCVGDLVPPDLDIASGFPRDIIRTLIDEQVTMLNRYSRLAQVNDAIEVQVKIKKGLDPMLAFYDQNTDAWKQVDKQLSDAAAEIARLTDQRSELELNLGYTGAKVRVNRNVLSSVGLWRPDRSGGGKGPAGDADDGGVGGSGVDHLPPPPAVAETQAVPAREESPEPRRAPMPKMGFRLPDPSLVPKLSGGSGGAGSRRPGIASEPPPVAADPTSDSRSRPVPAPSSSGPPSQQRKQRPLTRPPPLDGHLDHSDPGSGMIGVAGKAVPPRPRTRADSEPGTLAEEDDATRTHTDATSSADSNGDMIAGGMLRRGSSGSGRPKPKAPPRRGRTRRDPLAVARESVMISDNFNYMDAAPPPDDGNNLPPPPTGDNGSFALPPPDDGNGFLPPPMDLPPPPGVVEFTEESSDGGFGDDDLPPPPDF